MGALILVRTLMEDLNVSVMRDLNSTMKTNAKVSHML